MGDGQEPRSQLRYYFYLAAFYDLFQLSSRLERQILGFNREKEKDRVPTRILEETTPRAIKLDPSPPSLLPSLPLSSLFIISIIIHRSAVAGRLLFHFAPSTCFHFSSAQHSKAADLGQRPSPAPSRFASTLMPPINFACRSGVLPSPLLSATASPAWVSFYLFSDF